MHHNVTYALQVMASSWFDSWRRDMRASSMMYRVAEGGMRAVGQGTMWTVGAVAGVGRVTTRVVTSCVAARYASTSGPVSICIQRLNISCFNPRSEVVAL